ncbi:MAG TPA: hypothetical protein PKW64_03840 [Segatella copri]|nr:hypothetical protein [Segatella copri]
MDHGVINPNMLSIPKKKGEDLISVAPTFYGEEYKGNKAYLKFNNAIKRMAEHREVEQIETDVEFVDRNEDGSIYAVVYHYPIGKVDSDMLVRLKTGAWMLCSSNFRFYSGFVSAYICSIYGYKKVSELQIARELAEIPALLCKIVYCDDEFAFGILPGGFILFRYFTKDGDLVSLEMIDFYPYEVFKRDKINTLYLDLLHGYVSEGIYYYVENFPDELKKEIMRLCSERLRKKRNK